MIKSNLRKDILIDDQYTVEVDFSGFHISLAYALEGHQPPKDPYVLSNLLISVPRNPQQTAKEHQDACWKQQRKDVKLLALTGINAKDRKTTYRAFRNSKNDEQRGLPKSQKISYPNSLLEPLLDAFLTENQPIAHYLCADKGVELMAVEAQVTTEVIRHFTTRDIPILTVHDSYIIDSRYQEELEDVMQSATQDLTSNVNFKLTLDKVSTTQIRAFSNQDPLINSYDYYKPLGDSIIKTEGYKKRFQKFQRYLQQYPG